MADLMSGTVNSQKIKTILPEIKRWPLFDCSSHLWANNGESSFRKNGIPGILSDFR